jgi:hypothetical protein
MLTQATSQNHGTKAWRSKYKEHLKLKECIDVVWMQMINNILVNCIPEC